MGWLLAVIGSTWLQMRGFDYKVAHLVEGHVLAVGTPPHTHTHNINPIHKQSNTTTSLCCMLKRNCRAGSVCVCVCSEALPDLHRPVIPRQARRRVRPDTQVRPARPSNLLSSSLLKVRSNLLKLSSKSAGRIGRRRADPLGWLRKLKHS